MVLVPPRPDPVLDSTSPWRLVRVTEVVYPDGAIRTLDQKTLTNGNDAARFARF